jgi:cell division transport system permease protein
MGVFKHCFWEAFKALIRRPTTTVLAVASIALSLVLAGTIWLAGRKLDLVSQGWARGAVVSVYLREQAPPVAVRRVKKALTGLPGLHALRFVDKKKALAKLKANLGTDKHLLEGIEAAWLPVSFEITLRGDRRTLLAAQDQLKSIGQALAAVEEVRTLRRWHRQLDRLAGTLELAAGVLVLLTLLVCGFVVAATVRLGMLDRRREIRIQRRLGATRRLIAAPILLEGALQALLGSVVAAAIFYALHTAAMERFSMLLGAEVGLETLKSIPWHAVLWAVGMTTLAGLVGSGLAVSRHSTVGG